MQNKHSMCPLHFHTEFPESSSRTNWIAAHISTPSSPAQDSCSARFLGCAIPDSNLSTYIWHIKSWWDGSSVHVQLATQQGVHTLSLCTQETTHAPINKHKRRKGMLNTPMYLFILRPIRVQARTELTVQIQSMCLRVQSEFNPVQSKFNPVQL